MKTFLTVISLFASSLAIANVEVNQATGGSFSCSTTSLEPGKNIFVQGIIDGEANVLEAYRMQVDGDDNRTDLEAKGLSLLEQFEIELQDSHTPEEPTNIQIKAQSINGNSAAEFEIRNGEALEKATGNCVVRFESGV